MGGISDGQACYPKKSLFSIRYTHSPSLILRATLICIHPSEAQPSLPDMKSPIIQDLSSNTRGLAQLLHKSIRSQDSGISCTAMQQRPSTCTLWEMQAKASDLPAMGKMAQQLVISN